ncbi:MAG: chaperone NapD [Gammaproteobacteria bacterium]
MADTEYHVASFVVHAYQDQTAEITAALNSMAGVEVHTEHQSKLVVTAEAESVQGLTELNDAIQLLDGVVAIAPVYHEFTDDPDAALPDPSSKSSNQVEQP